MDHEAFAPIIENATSVGRVIVVCEHASNVIPSAWGDLGLTEAQQVAHIAWDPGALGLARGLATRLGAVLVHAPVSRLVYDLNRPPNRAGAMTEKSESHHIPGNAALSVAERLRRTQSIYLPFHTVLHGLVAGRIALQLAPVIVTVHSFTPVYFGQPRTVEFGVIHDADPRLAHAVVAAAQGTGLRTELNAPYSAADGVTHTLALHATPYGLPHVMLEIRNDLIADAAKQDAMAALLAPVINMGIEEIQKQAKAG